MAPKMKRRDLDGADDEFFEFSLSSPATKIRRLDAEVAPIADKEEEPFEIEEAMGDSSLDLPSMNEERAIVLYKPIYSHLLLSPDRSNFSLQINSDLIPGLKIGLFQRGKGVSPVSTEAAEAAEMAEEDASVEVEVEEKEKEEEEEEEEGKEGKGNTEQVNTSNGGVVTPWQWQWQWQNHCMELEQQQQQFLLNPTTPMMWSS